MVSTSSQPFFLMSKYRYFGTLNCFAGVLIINVCFLQDDNYVAKEESFGPVMVVSDFDDE